jgi:flagellar basal body-associated protein FliL
VVVIVIVVSVVVAVIVVVAVVSSSSSSSKAVHVFPTKVYKGSRSIASLILNLGTRRTWVVSLTL